MDTWPVPPGLSRLGGTTAGAAWLSSPSGLVAECAERWDLRVGTPYPGGHSSLVAPARRRGAGGAQDPVPRRGRRRRGGRAPGAGRRRGVRLLARDPARRALLLERCEPGERLSDRPSEEAFEVLTGLLPRLWRPAPSPPFRTLREQAARWRAAGRRPWAHRAIPPRPRARRWPCFRPAAPRARCFTRISTRGTCSALDASPGRRSTPPRWRAGKAFGAVPPVSTWLLAHDRAGVRHRLDRVSAELGLDRERVRLWRWSRR